MSLQATDLQESVLEGVASPLLPADHVLHSAAVLFPGAFDQHGSPLIVFPADEQAKLSSELSKAEVVDFINYFLCLHNKRQDKDSLVSVVADLRHASLHTTRVIAETLLLLEVHKRTVHSVYIIQPKKKNVVKLLLKILFPSKSYTAPFKKVFLKEISELSNYIDRSQLMTSLGGYLLYCHHSWVAFIKDIEEFVQKFLSVVQRLPSCISSLQALSRLPLPSTFSELQHFSSTNEAKFQQLRRELGLDDLLNHCESMVEKLHYPEKEPYYQAMAGTALFTHTALDMLQNHSRITAAVEKVELLWQQAFSKARLQLQVLQLREDALQITEQIKTLLQEKLQPFKIEIAKDAVQAVMLVSEFEVSIHTPAMALIRCAEDVIHTVAEILLVDGQTKEHWVLDLERLNEKVHSAVHFILQTLRAVSSYHHHYNKANSWYGLVLCDNILQVMLSGVNADGVSVQRQRNWGTIPAWRYKMSTFLRKNPPPDVEELVHLAHLSNAIPDDEMRKVGKQMAQRCMTLRKLLICSGPVAVGHLQLALQWQYEMFRRNHGRHSSAHHATDGSAPDAQGLGKCESGKEAAHRLKTSPSAVRGTVSAEGKPSSLSSFDSGFDGAGPTQSWGGKEAVKDLCTTAGARDSVRPAMSTPQIHKENISSVSDCEGSVGGASIQIIPKVTVDSLNVEIKVKRSAALPSNPWLSLPVDDLENSYTVTITQNPTPQKTDLLSLDSSDPCTKTDQSTRSKDQPTQTEVLNCAQPRGPQVREWTRHSKSGLEDSELSPIRNILSSTITEGRDKSICTTEGIPTLLWDSYDLHEQDLEADDGGIDISLNDWEVKEQEGLSEVQKILDRADEILEKEEHVLAQEAVLEALLRSEDHYDQWPPWDREEHLTVMSSSELAEAGVLGLDDYLEPAQSDHVTEPRPGSTNDTKASEDDGHGTEAADTVAFQSRPDLLRELRQVHILDELIIEENLKICKLQSCNENPKEELSVGKLLGSNLPSSVSKEREALRSQIEKEKREVEKLEESLCHDRKVKKHKDRPRKVVRCSIMEKASSANKADQALCDELLLDSCNRSQRAHSTPLLQNDSQTQDTCETESISDVLVAPAITQNLVFNPEVKEHNSNNNNCHHVSLEHQSEIPPESEKETVVPACLDLHPVEEAQASSPAGQQSTSPQLPPDQPLEFDPGGRYEQHEDLLDGAQSSESMRISDSGPVGIQAQPNIMREMTDFKTPIVLDTGSGLMKAGFADQDLPNIIFPTIIGVPKYEEVMNDNLERETYIGHAAQHMRGVLALKHPIKNGVIHNWDDMEKIWHHTFQQLCVDADEHPVLLTEAAMNPLENRQRMVELMFECFNVPFTYVAMQPVLSLYAAGRSTGVVFDSGDGVSHSVPVFEGYCLAHGVQRFPLAGVDVTLHLKKLLQEQGVCMRTTAEVEIVRDMKERCCCVALDYEAELSQGGASSKLMHYSMPDGQTVTLSTERFRAPEILFKPELIGQDHYGMHETIFKSILSSDIDLRRCFLGNIILSGGNTLLPGLPERLQAEIKGLVPANTGDSVRVTSPKDRDFSVWRGGAVLANLPTFSSAWISREEYEEHGPHIIFRKCF